MHTYIWIINISMNYNIIYKYQWIINTLMNNKLSLSCPFEWHCMSVIVAHFTGKSTVLLRLTKPSVTGLLWGNPPVTDQRWSLRKNTSNGESASLSWRHHHTGNNYLIPYDDVIKWKHFPHYWPFVRGIHRSPVNSPHKGQWHGALMFTLI